jgi:hypothetical protein
VSVEAVIFTPAAPLLVPAVAGGSAGLDDVMRTASLAAVAGALDGRPDDVVVVASAAASGEWPPTATWDFAGFGVPVTGGAGRPRLPWSLGIGAWLLDECGWEGPRRYVAVSADPQRRVDGEPRPERGASADGGHGRSSVVIAVGDGSACRTERAPGYLDERAESFDAAIGTALDLGDVAALAGLDDDLAADLLCRSLPVWRWVAAAMDSATVTAASLELQVAPYGVGYFVASWSLSRQGNLTSPPKLTGDVTSAPRTDG